MNYMGILFLTDFWTEKQIPRPREGKKITLGEEFVSRAKHPSGIGYSL